MNQTELTPTQRVAKAQSQSRCISHTQLLNLALELAAELERVQKAYVLQRESHEVEIYSWGQRNAQLSRQVEELLKDRKRLERLMTLERGDLLWFHQEQDKRRALDILMEDEE